MGDETKKADVGTQLAMTRTTLALDRTMLAWIRTCLALIGFGFTFAKFVHAVLQHSALKELKIDSPRNLGLMLMLLGVCGIAGGIIQYFFAHKRLRVVTDVSLWSAAFILAIGLMIAGLLMFLAIVLEGKVII